MDLRKSACICFKMKNADNTTIPQHVAIIIIDPTKQHCLAQTAILAVLPAGCFDGRERVEL